MPIRLHLIQLKWFERKGEKVSSVFRVLALVGPSRGSYSFLYACTVFIHNRLKMHSSVQLKLNLISGKCLHFGNAKMTSLCYSNWARNEWVKKKRERKEICTHKWVREAEDESERKTVWERERSEREGRSCRRAKASCLGTTAITAAAKTLRIHLHWLMETSQQALKPLRDGGPGAVQRVHAQLRMCVSACARSDIYINSAFSST